MATSLAGIEDASVDLSMEAVNCLHKCTLCMNAWSPLKAYTRMPQSKPEDSWPLPEPSSLACCWRLRSWKGPEMGPFLQWCMAGGFPAGSLLSPRVNCHGCSLNHFFCSAFRVAEAPLLHGPLGSCWNVWFAVILVCSISQHYCIFFNFHHLVPFFNGLQIY